jgi:hypothetical protein
LEQLQFTEIFGQKEILKDLRNYLAGRAEGFSRDESLLEEVLKTAFSHHYIHAKGELPNNEDPLNPEKLSVIYRLEFSKVCRKSPGLFPEESQLLLGPENISKIHHSLESIKKLKENDDDLVGNEIHMFFKHNRACDLAVFPLKLNYS